MQVEECNEDAKNGWLGTCGYVIYTTADHR